MVSPISFNALLNYSCCLLFFSFILKILASVKSSDQFLLFYSNFYSRKDQIFILKNNPNQKNCKVFSVPKNGLFTFVPCFQLFTKNEWDISKLICKYMRVKKRETVRNSIIHDAYNLGLVKELANYCKVSGIASYKMRCVCVIIKKYKVKKSPHFQIRQFTVKEIDAIKQVAHLNYFNYTSIKSKNWVKVTENCFLLRIAKETNFFNLLSSKPKCINIEINFQRKLSWIFAFLLYENFDF